MLVLVSILLAWCIDMKILHTVNQAQFDEIVFSFKSSEITDSGIDENEDGTMTSWDRGTVTLSADCHGAELLIQFDFVEYDGKGFEIAKEPYVKFNFRLVDDFFYEIDADAQKIIDAVPWEWHVKMELICAS